MALPGLFIEYLVVGSFALLWSLPAIAWLFPSVAGYASDMHTLKVAALAPAIYVLGMFVDSVAFISVTVFPRRGGTFKQRARWFVRSSKAPLGEDHAVVSGADTRVSAKDGFRQRGGFWVRLPSKLREQLAPLCMGLSDESLERVATSQIGHSLEIRLLAEMPDVAKQVQMRSSRDRIARSTVINLLMAGLVAVLYADYWLSLFAFVLAMLGVPIWAFFEAVSHSYKREALAVLEQQVFPPKEEESVGRGR